MTVERRRRTLRAERTSDVTRFRGVAVAALAAALVATVAVIALSSRDAQRGSPGPLSHPHQRAGLSCATCHGDATAAAPPSSACAGCHGAKRTPRPAHRGLVADGSLRCADCHPAHRSPGGVGFAPDGSARRYGPGGAIAVDAGLFRPAAAIHVPVVTVDACTRCHDAASPRDPIAACLLPGQDRLGAARPVLCLDEHRPVRDAAGALAPRSAAWEATRAIVAATPRAPQAPGRRTGPWAWLGLGLLGALGAYAGVRGVDRVRRRPLPPAEAAAIVAPALRRLPVIDTATCLGCHACVDACPYDVLEVRRYVAVVARPTDCCGLTLCEQKCPNGSLVMADRAPLEGSRPAVDDSLESRTVPGLYLAGDVTGQPLIRTAITQGAAAVRHIAARLPGKRADDLLDLLIVGAGPAGLAAALEARARGLRSLALEQATVADSIRSFPRGKLVTDLDPTSPGPLWLAETSKEELLARWTRTVREQQPAILEGQRVTAIAPASAGGFIVNAVDRDGKTAEHRARHVLLAIGRRGTPRPLSIEVPAGLASDVHYSLADARSFAGRRVLVVGLGDVAMEAAIALSRQPGTEVVVSYRGADFQRGKARNIAEIRRREASATLRIVWHSEVADLTPGRARLTTPAGPVEVGCDSVFVLIGSIPPEDLLRSSKLLQPQQIVPDREPLDRP